MNFSIFLKTLRAKQQCASVREQFDALGGEKKLEMSLRNFQLVEKGDRAPSEKLFLSVFRALPKEEYKNALLAYFQSHVDTRKDVELLAYLDQHLSPSMTSDSRSVFEAGRAVMTYSGEQLDFLTKNSEAMRLHHRVLLWERVSPRDLSGREAIARTLVSLSLADRDADGGLRPCRTVYRVPAYENSPPPAVRMATRYFGGMLKEYLSEEGSTSQNISFALQLVRPTIAQQILDQMSAFKRWVQNVASSETGPGLVPFLFVSYGKKLEEREF